MPVETGFHLEWCNHSKSLRAILRRAIISYLAIHTRFCQTDNALIAHVVIAKSAEAFELNIIDIHQRDSSVPPGLEHSVGDLTRHWRAWLISEVANSTAFRQSRYFDGWLKMGTPRSEMHKAGNSPKANR
jgi:hypothetical protein